MKKNTVKTPAVPVVDETQKNEEKTEVESFDAQCEPEKFI